MKLKNEILKLEKNQVLDILEKHKGIDNPVERMEQIWNDMNMDTQSASVSIILYLNDTDTELGLEYAKQASLDLITDGFIEWEQYIDADNKIYIDSLVENYLSGALD